MTAASPIAFADAATTGRGLRIRQVIQRETYSGEPAGWQAGFGKGAGVTPLTLVLSQPVPALFGQIYDSTSPGASEEPGSGRRLGATVQLAGQTASGTVTLSPTLPATPRMIYLDIAATADMSDAARSTPFGIGDLTAILGRSYLSMWNSSWCYYGGTIPVLANLVKLPPGTGSILTVTDYRYGPQPQSHWVEPGNAMVNGVLVGNNDADTKPIYPATYETSGGMEAIRILNARDGVVQGVFGIGALGGGLETWCTGIADVPPGAGWGTFAAMIGPIALGKFRRFVFGADGTDTGLTREPQQAIIAAIFEKIPTLSSVPVAMIFDGMGWWQPNGSSVKGLGFGYVDVAAGDALERRIPRFRNVNTFASNRWMNGHSTMQSRKQMIWEQVRAFWVAEGTDRGGPSITGAARAPGSPVIRLRTRQGQGTALTTCSWTEDARGNMTTATPAQNPAELVKVVAVYDAGGCADNPHYRVASVALDAPAGEVLVTLATAGGRLVKSDGSTVPLEPREDTLALRLFYGIDYVIENPGTTGSGAHVCDNADYASVGIPYGNPLRGTAEGVDVPAPAPSAQPTRISVPPAPSPPSSVVPASAVVTSSVRPATSAGGLRGVTFTQPAPAHPMMAEQASIGYLTPVGPGVGPYRYAITDNQGGRYGVEWNTGRVYGFYTPLGTSADRLIGTCQDAAGTVVTFNIPVVKQSDARPAIFFNDNPVIVGVGQGNCQPNTHYQFHVQAFGGSHTMHDAGAVQDPSGTWCWFYGLIAPASLTAPPPPGTYKIAVTRTAAAAAAETATIDIAIVVEAPRPLVIQRLATLKLSAATPVGTVIERLAATTPSNAASWSMTDPTGTLLIDTVKGEVVVMQPPKPGPLHVTYQVTDGTASGSLSTVFAVEEGTVLPAAAMTMAVASGLINAGRGQVIGTPVVAGHGGGTWRCLDRTGFNPNAELGVYGCKRRIVQDSTAGRITAPGVLSSETIQLEVTWIAADGRTSCVRTFDIPVAAAPVVVYHVGKGMSAAHGPFGLETLAAARALSNTPSTKTYHFKVYANADPDYYTGANLVNDYSQGWGEGGPVILEGVAANGVAQPRAGGKVGSAKGGGDYIGKGPFVFRNHDAHLVNLEISDVNGSGLTDGLEAVRKDGQTYGNLTLTGCNIHDCNNGLETGVCHGNILVESCEFANCGTSHTSAGNDHNIYVGSVSSFRIRNSVSRRATLGHGLKSRARVTTLENYVYLATTGGQEAVPAEFPNAGVVTISGGMIQKAVMAQNPYAVLYCAERDFGVPGAVAADLFPWTENRLHIEGASIDVMMMGGAHLGQPAAVAYYRCRDPYGRWMPPPVVADTSMWLSQGASRTRTMAGLGDQTLDTTPEHQVVETGGMTRPLPVVPPTARPHLQGVLPVMGAFRWSGQWGGDSYRNFDSGQHVQSVNDLRVSGDVTPGTALMTLRATTGSFNQLAKPNPFGAGTTWSLPTTGIYYPTAPHDPFAAPGAFGITTNPDGTGTLTAGSGLAAGQVYYVQVRATAPSDVAADYRYAVVIA